MAFFKRNEHVDMAYKLQDKEIRHKYINQELQEGGVFKYLGLNNRKVGPPRTLTKKERDGWNERIEECLRNCIWDILLPALKSNIEDSKQFFTRTILDALLVSDEEAIRRQVLKGFARAQRKWRKRNYQNSLRLPCSLGNFGTMKSEEVGCLKRGELVTTEKKELVHDIKINKSKDLLKILAHSIYGSSKYRNLVHRSIWKYINAYAIIEESKFHPHVGILNNGTEKWIGSWHTFCALLKNRDLCFSIYELNIISRLYDVNIHVYEINNVYVFNCMWQTGRKCNRVINLLLSVIDEWSLLVRKEENIEDKRVSKDNVIDILNINTDSSNSNRHNQVVNSSRKVEVTNRQRVLEERELEWSLITTESESRKELTISEDKLNSLTGVDSNDNIQTIDNIVRVEEKEIFDNLSDIFSTITDSQTSFDNSLIRDSPREVVEVSSKGQIETAVLDWSLITEDSDSKKEIAIIEDKLNKQAWQSNVNSQNKDSLTRVEGNNTQKGLEVEELDWSLITMNSDRRKDLLEIEDKIKRQSWMENTPLNCSMLTISTDDNSHFEKENEIPSRSTNNNNKFITPEVINIVDNTGLEGNEYTLNRPIGGKRVVERDIRVDITDSSSREDGNNSLVVLDNQGNKFRMFQLQSSRPDSKRDYSQKSERSIDSDIEECKEGSLCLRNSRMVGSGDRLDNYISDNMNREKKDKSKLDSDISMSSVEEDLRWLFEEEVQDKTYHCNNSIAESMTDIETEVSRDVLNNNNNRQHKRSKSRRRKFWMKWKSKIRNIKRNNTRKDDRLLHKEGIQQKNTAAVFDYYSKGLEKSEVELLSKGSTLSIASIRLEEDKFKADIYAYSRRLRLHEEFRDQSLSQVFSQVLREQRENRDSNDSSPDSVNHTPNNNKKKEVKGRKLPSTYDPDSQNRNLARYCNCIQEESILAVKSKSKFKDNISKEHRLALNTLKKKVEDREIVITLADKGSGIVVVDYDTYIRKGTKYIEVEAKAYSESTKSHKQIVTDIVNQRNKITKKLREYKVIELDTATYCMKQLEEKVTGMKFYYKVHKDTNIDTMPLRPLQSCIGSPTHHLSQVLTDLLQPYLTSEYIPTFIQDSNQLLYRLSKINSLELNSTLISSDVAALYPSIPHKEGLESVKKFLIEWSNYNNIQIRYIMLALELVITQNFVMWNGKIYSQDSGVAMGTPVAVAYANIFMDWIDKQLRQKATYIIEHIRYIDDNLFIIPEDKIEELMAVANSLLVPHIRFTYEKLDKSSDIGLPFLDTQLFISSELTIDSRLYTKKTDKHTYLLPTSFHPSHITRNIPLAVFNRIRRICSKHEWFQADAMLAIQWLEDRGYKYVDIKKAVEKSSKRDRWKMIEKIEDNRDNRLTKVDTNNKAIYEVPIIITYSHNARKLKDVLKNRQTLLDASFNQTQVRPRLAYRRQRNINDILIQKGLRKPILGNITEEHILERCGNKHKFRIPCPCKGTHNQQVCRCCAHLYTKLDNIEVRLHKKVNCETKNLIYLLGCKICHKLYVGETQQQLKDRFLQHLNNITKLSQPLYTHFRQVHKAENLYISVLESVRSSDHTFRKIREVWWINKLQTLEPRGFNIKLKCSQIYQASNTTISIEKDRRSKHI